jgi:mRNA deadenylase 3'-5' endonuclease subunit Ccr4
MKKTVIDTSCTVHSDYKIDGIYGNRVWREVPRECVRRERVISDEIIDKVTKESPRFKIISYNVLAQVYCLPYRFPYCEPYYLKWRVRRLNFMKEILSYDADVVCLQEIDSYEEFWQPQMSDAGYDSIYKKRSGSKRDGVAVFFKRKLYQIFNSKVIYLNDIAKNIVNANDASRACQDNIALIVSLQPWEKSNHTSAKVVVSCQLHWDPAVEHVQLMQAQSLFRAIEIYNSSFQLPVIVCGSFNCVPSSGVYHFLTTGCLKPKPLPPQRVTPPLCIDPSQSTIDLQWKAPEEGDAPIIGYLIERRAGGNTAYGFGKQVSVDVKDCVITSDSSLPHSDGRVANEGKENGEGKETGESKHLDEVNSGGDSTSKVSIESEGKEAQKDGWLCDLCDSYNDDCSLRDCPSCSFTRVPPPRLHKGLKYKDHDDPLDTSRSATSYKLASHEMNLTEDVWNKKKITGLSSGIYYEFRVSAINKYGCSPWSAPSKPYRTNSHKKNLVDSVEPVVDPPKFSDYSIDLIGETGLTPRYEDGSRNYRSAPLHIPQGTEVKGVQDVARAHTLNLSSVMAALPGGEPSFTTAGENFTGTADYILYSTELLLPIHVLSPLSIEEIKSDDFRQAEKIPDPNFPKPSTWDDRRFLLVKDPDSGEVDYVANTNYSGEWKPPLIKNENRSINYMPTSVYSSDHYSIGAEFAFIEANLPAIWH